MMTQDHYCVNVAIPGVEGWNGKTTYRHHFAVDTTSEAKAITLTDEFRRFYPDAKITVTRWVIRGQEVEL